MNRRYEGACPDDGELAAFIEQTLGDDVRGAVEEHLDACTTCRETIGHVAATEQSSRQLGRYRLDHEIGRGGMGVVWRAWDPALERALAIKLLRPEATDQLGAARFEREARALAKLQHPNVIAIYDVGNHAGEMFIATELIDGESMDRWQRQRPPGDVIAAYAQAARGLAAAHLLGLVHRDVKPSNILVAQDGRVRVGDFGLAIRETAVTPTEPATGESRLTDAGAIVGTPAYMAPEQRAGAVVDARADQYSLCIALTEALLGARPAPDATAAELAAKGVTAPWDAIARGLATRPADRHPDLGPLIIALGGEPVRRRWPVVMIASAAVVVAAVVTIIALRTGGSDAVAACESRRPLAGVWDAATSGSITNRFRAAKVPYGDDAATAVVHAVDAWAIDLEVEDRHACEDAATEKQSPEVVRKRATCLARAREQLVAFVDGLGATPDAKTIQGAPGAARDLPAPSACNTEVGLADLVIAPDPVTAASVDALSARVTKARSLRHLGKLREARTLADAVVADAHASGLLPSLAEAQHELGTIQHAQKDDRAAEQTLEDALAVAAQAHADYRAAEISAMLVEIIGVKGGLDVAERQARLARSANIRAGNDRRLDAVIERGLGRTDLEVANFPDAYDHYKRAEAVHTALGLGDDVDFDLRAQVAALDNMKRLDEADRINQRLIASDLEHLGPKHPRTIGDTAESAVILHRGGHDVEAIAALEKVMVVSEEVFGRDSSNYTTRRAQLAGMYFAVGRFEDARAQLAAAVPLMAAHVPPDNKDLRGARKNLADVSIQLGHYDEAKVQLVALLDVARAAKDDRAIASLSKELAEVDHSLATHH